MKDINYAIGKAAAVLLVAVGLLVVGALAVFATSVDDEFSSGTLDGKWTVTSGSSGTVNDLATNPSNVYDLSDTGYLSLQAEDDTVYLRQDATLADGNDLILKIHPAVNASGDLDNEVASGLNLNCDDGSPSTYTTCGYIYLNFRANTDGWEITCKHVTSGGVSSSTLMGEPGGEYPTNGGSVWLRISRSGTSYACLTSFDGIGWAPMKTFFSNGSAFNNIWIRNRSDVDSGTDIVPVQKIDYIREQ